MIALADQQQIDRDRSEVIQIVRETLVSAEQLRTADWFRVHYRSDDGSPFLEGTVPWVTAPNGPCDAVDNPKYRYLWLQWSARAFKTNFAHGLAAMHAHQDPCNMMMATVDRELCANIMNRFWESAERMPVLRDQVPHKKLRSSSRANLERCIIHGAWSRGKSQLADRHIRFGHANEVDRWVVETTSDEGDPLGRLFKRGAQYPDALFLVEGTPGRRGRSRVERGRLRSTNCDYWVPCPHCSRFQSLEFCFKCYGRGCRECGIAKSGGLRWDRSNREFVKEAVYICRHCSGEIEDYHRFEMINSGVWVPEACSVDDDLAMRARELDQFDYRWLIGAQKEGEHWGSRIHMCYDLYQGGWARSVNHYLECDTVLLQRQRITESMALTWEPVHHEDDWQVVAGRIIDNEVPRSTVPSWVSLITMAVDRQQDYFVFGVLGWGPGRRHHWIQYGEVNVLDDLSPLLDASFDYEDSDKGHAPQRIAMTIVDNGFRPDSDVEDWAIAHCRRGKQVWTCKGSSKALESEYQKRVLGKNTAKPGLMYYSIDTILTNEWAEKVLYEHERPEPGSASVHAGSLDEHQDLFEQLINQCRGTSEFGSGDSQTWDKVHNNIPDDLRDVMRYGYVAMLEVTRGRPIPERPEPNAATRNRTTRPPVQRQRTW